LNQSGLSLGVDLEQFADAAGISAEALHEYENTQPDHDFVRGVAQRVGSTLERLQAILTNSEAAGIRQELRAKVQLCRTQCSTSRFAMPPIS